MVKKKQDKESSVKDILKGRRTFKPSKPTPQLVIKLKKKEENGNPGNPHRSDRFNNEMEKERKAFLR